MATENDQSDIKTDEDATPPAAGTQPKPEQKKKKQSKLKDLNLEVYAYKNEEKKEVKLFLPRYFTREERYDNAIDQQTDRYNAQSFLLGLDLFASQGSVTAFVTYSGPKRRYTVKAVGIATRAVLQQRGDWKITMKTAFLVNDVEWTGHIKDHEFIRLALTSPGGKQNLMIRFEKDAPFQGKKKEIAKVFRKDEERHRKFSYRMKLSHAKQGIKPVLKGLEEAKLLRDELTIAANPDSKDVLKFLGEKIREFEAQKKRQAQEREKQQTR